MEINDTITMLLSENRLGDELSYAYDPKELKIRKEKKEIKKEIEHEIGKYGYSLFLFVVTDIINSNSLVFTYGKEIEIVENAFKKEVVNNEILLENVVSRKKQIIPFLMTAAQNM